jgi:hypothetical protein
VVNREAKKKSEEGSSPRGIGFQPVSESTWSPNQTPTPHPWTNTPRQPQAEGSIPVGEICRPPAVCRFKGPLLGCADCGLGGWLSSTPTLGRVVPLGRPFLHSKTRQTGSLSPRRGIGFQPVSQNPVPWPRTFCQPTDLPRRGYSSQPGVAAFAATPGTSPTKNDLYPARVALAAVLEKPCGSQVLLAAYEAILTGAKWCFMGD